MHDGSGSARDAQPLQEAFIALEASLRLLKTQHGFLRVLKIGMLMLSLAFVALIAAFGYGMKSDLDQHSSVAYLPGVVHPVARVLDTAVDGILIHADGMAAPDGNTSRPASLLESRKTVLHVSNRSHADLNVFWLDYAGQPIPYAKLAPGRHWDEQTHATHSWRFVAHGATLATLISTEQPGTVEIGNVVSAAP